ncbi:MAG: hypothetical protein O2856_20275 [Planctomycetota bacterium]|nr:hypothetical protein [Planctomycetota bacterium]
MIVSQNNGLRSRLWHRSEDETHFNTDESAMIWQYECLRDEWDEQLDFLESTDPVTRRHALQEAELLDKQLTTMEWKLPERYTCPSDAAPPSGATSIASAFARLLHNHRQTSSRADAAVEFGILAEGKK